MSVPPPDPGYRPVVQPLHQALQEGGGASLHGVDHVHWVGKLWLIEIRILEAWDMRIYIIVAEYIITYKVQAGSNPIAL